MTIQEIPKAYVYTCEGCGHYVRQENANGHYTNSTPPRWATLVVKTYNGVNSEKLFCQDCSEPLVNIIENWKGK